LLPRLFSNVKIRQEARLDSLNKSITHLAQLKLSTFSSQLSTIESKLPILLDRRLMTEKHRMQLIEEKAKSLDPTLLLKRGYSITLKDGKAVRDVQQLQTGDEIEARLANGTVHSTVK
jgi:exodeoxyribonuclease VII large subunit